MARRWGWILVVALVLVAAACGQRQGTAERSRVRLQLKWVTQAQFAGYYAAQAKGYYAQEHLDVTITPGGQDIAPEQVVAGGGAEFGINWLPSLLASRDRGTGLINIAQVFASSGMRQIAFRDSGIRTPADFKGRRIAVWFDGNEFALLATLDKYRLDRHKDVTLVQQPLDMNLLLKREVDAASAMTYNEYKQVLDAGVKPEDLVVIDFNKEGTAMLEDGIFVKEDWLKDPHNKEIAGRFLRASFRGWEFCRDHADECVRIVLGHNSALSLDHQTWMMGEVNRLVWGPPSPAAFGKMPEAAFARTAAIALKFGVIKKPADARAYTTEIWEMAARQ
jgi:NitT/TauT family transport system substrate-binding protein